MDGYQKETIAQLWAFSPLPGEKNFFEKEKGRPLIWPTDGPFYEYIRFYGLYPMRDLSALTQPSMPRVPLSKTMS